MPRAFGLLLQVFAAVIALQQLQPNVAAVPLINQGFIGPLLIGLPLMFAAWLLRRALPHSGSRWANAWQPAERTLEKPWFMAGFTLQCAAQLLQSASDRVVACQLLQGQFASSNQRGGVCMPAMTVVEFDQRFRLQHFSL